MIGQTLSHFRITALLGEGGMGAVYRAEDTRLDREVAIKVLPDAFTADPERLARFEREAKVLASLNHPNIAAIHEFGSAPGVGGTASVHFLAIELVEGGDLAERLARGSIPVDEARDVARQIAQGLEAAHARGVVHRDLKPANIRITPTGLVKILDFGLAKACEKQAEQDTDLSQSPTKTAQMTRAGVILGTAGYMSPEQARGESADQRADIWSFGVVLYEMLTGGALFGEPTASDTLAAVLRAEIAWDRLPEETPEFLRRLLRRCLVRDARQRLHSIADARLELEAGEDGAGSVASHAASPRMAWGRLLLGALAGSLITAAILLLLPASGDGPGVRRQVRVVELLDGVGVDYFSVQWGLNVSEPRISPDGSMIVYPSGGSLWIRDLDRLEPRPIEGTEGASDAFWSPDSESLAYVAGAELRRVGAQGGPSVLLARLEGAFLGGTWGTGRIVVGLGGRGLLELPERGGEPQLLLPADAESGDFDFHSPAFLDDGESLAFVLHERSGYVRTIEIFDGAARRVVHRAPEGSRVTGLAFDASARRLVAAKIRSNAGLWAVPLESGGPTSEAESQLLIANGLAPSISTDGVLVYVDGLQVTPSRLMRVDRNGTVIGGVGQALWDQDRPVASPDGSRVASIATNSGAREVWVHDLERDTALRVTAETPENITVAWSDQGEAIVYATRSDGVSRLVKRRADGGGEPEVLIEGQIGRPSLPHDGRFVVYQVGGNRLRRGPGDLWWFPVGQPEKAAPLIATPSDEVEPAVSPDGKLLAYTSDESGRYEVYLLPLSGDGKRQRVSQQGGEAPLWSRDGSELYYVGNSTLFAVPVSADGETLGSPRHLFSDSDVSGPLVQNGISAVTLGPDDDFLVVQRVIPGTPRVVAVENWTALLESR